MVGSAAVALVARDVEFVMEAMAFGSGDLVGISRAELVGTTMVMVFGAGTVGMVALVTALATGGFDAARGIGGGVFVVGPAALVGAERPGLGSRTRASSGLLGRAEVARSEEHTSELQSH